MAILSLSQQKLWVDGYDLTTRISAMSLDTGVEELDSTAFGAIAKGRTAGLRTAAFEHEGYVELGTDLIDEVLFDRLAQSDITMSIGVETGADGELAYIAQMLQLAYTPGATVGEMYKFTVSGSGNGPAIRATIMHNAQRIASGTGTARQLGEVTTGKRLYAALHVTEVSAGDTLDVIVRSDDNSGMTTPTTRITFTQVTSTVTGQWMTTAVGPLTPSGDTWWDVDWTIGGASPQYTFVVALGIL